MGPSPRVSWEALGRAFCFFFQKKNSLRKGPGPWAQGRVLCEAKSAGTLCICPSHVHPGYTLNKGVSRVCVGVHVHRVSVLCRGVHTCTQKSEKGRPWAGPELPKDDLHGNG